MNAALSRIIVYPVKSLGGVELGSAAIDEFGLRHDRRWMVVDEHGRFQTQRWRPRMALARAAIDGEEVRLIAAGMPDLPLAPGGGASAAVAVWDDICVAEGCGAEADVWMSRFLGEACRVVYMPASSRRPTRRRREESLGRVGFADAYPFLLVSEASLAALNERLAAPVPMNRFRPNLVVGGVAPHGEDSWSRGAIGGVPFVVTKQCERCVLTTIDQDTGVGGREPLRTLASYRTHARHVLFGVYLAHSACGTVGVGDSVRATPD